MINQVVSLLGAMYDAMGLGLVLAMALPLSVLALGLVVAAGVRRYRQQN